MPFGQSALLTSLTLGLTRRATFCVQRCCGASPEAATRAADEVGLSAAATVAAVAGILTLDPIGSAISAGYIAAEAGEAERRHAGDGKRQ
jgi:hypothetical protein